MDQEARFTDVGRVNGADGETVNVPDFDGGTAGASDPSYVDSRVGVSGAVTVEADTEAAGHVHGDLAQDETAGSGEAEAKVGITSEGQVGNLYARGAGGFNGTAIAAKGCVERAADFEDFVGADGYGVGADGARGHDGEALAGCQGVEGGLNGCQVRGAAVDGCAPPNRGEGPTAACHAGCGRTATALGEDEGGKGEEEERKEMVQHLVLFNDLEKRGSLVGKIRRNETGPTGYFYIRPSRKNTRGKADILIHILKGHPD